MTVIKWHDLSSLLNAQYITLTYGWGMVDHAISLIWSVCVTAQVVLSVLARKYDWLVDVHETFIQTSPLPAVTNGMPMKCWAKAEPLECKAKAAAADQADGHLRV